MPLLSSPSTCISAQVDFPMLLYVGTFCTTKLRNLLSSSISLLISCFFYKIRKLLYLNHCLSYLGNQFCSKGTSLKSGPGSRPPPLTSQDSQQETNPSYREQPRLEGTLNVGQPKQDAGELKSMSRPGEFIKNAFLY